MRKFLKVLGAILMAFNAIAAFSLVVTLPSVFGEKDLLAILVSYFIFLIAACALFYLGYRLYTRERGTSKKAGSADAGRVKAAPAAGKKKAPAAGKKKEAPDNRAHTARVDKAEDGHKAEAVKADAPRAVRPKASPVVPEKSAKKRPFMPAAYWGEVILYWDPEAEERSGRVAFPVLYEVRAALREGEPVIIGGNYVHKEIGVGKEWTETETDALEIPRELFDKTDFIGGLREWLGSCRRDWPIDWENADLISRLSAWHRMVKGLISRKLPDCVYEVGCPFGWAEDVAPDGVYNESFVGMWLRMKKDAKPSKVIRALIKTEREKATVVLTDDAGLLIGDSALTTDDLRLCELGKIRFGLLKAGEGFIDLAKGKEYFVRTETWPGSADDAATYGRWWLEERPRTPEQKLDAVTLKIVTDCRGMGVPEERIRRLLTDVLNRDIRDDCCRLTYDSEPEQYAIDYYERGTLSLVISDADETDFRFKFIGEFIYHCSSFSSDKRGAEEELLRKTKAQFSGSELYKKAVRDYYSLFPDSDALPGEPNPFEKVCFGRYPQTAEGNDLTPIEWIVLERGEDSVLLLSRRALDARPFSTFGGEPLWENSSIRAWLNGPFMEKAFGDTEKKSIVESALDNSAIGYRWWIGGNDTRDKVFLLSWPEAFRGRSFERVCLPTDHAVKRIGKPYLKDGYCSWMLRTTGYEMHDNFHVCEVNCEGNSSFDQFFDRKQFVRPALRVRAESIVR